MTQTATQWLIVEILKNMGVWIPPHIQDQAKEMEKKQMIDAWDNGCEYDGIIDSAEQYYNETYNK